MALIKCTQCGKDISDKANECVHCGCTIEEKVIMDTKMNVNDLKKAKSCGFAILGIADIIILFFLLLASEMEELLIPTILFWAVVFLPATIFPNLNYYKKVAQCSLTLTNKRIYGTCYGLISSGKIKNWEKIDFPLHQVTAISKLRDCVRVDLSVGKYITCFSSNADEFIMAVEKELTRFKNK